MDTQTAVGSCSTLFIVSDVSRSLDYYIEALGFECRYRAPDAYPIFAIVGRDLAQIMIKSVSNEVTPKPNCAQHDWVKWDAFIHVGDPDLLAVELSARDTDLPVAAQDTEDGLRGFALSDPDGYVCFYGRSI